ncbi:hypothetical protein C0993_010113, partial [Termitomyces sp. T159_Od127]
MQVVHFLMVFAPMSELEGMLVRKFKFDLADTSHSLRTAFGGFGFTSRMWGLTLDTVKAINTVLANGTIIRATAENHPDLFWLAPILDTLLDGKAWPGVASSYEAAPISDGTSVSMVNTPQGSPFLGAKKTLK